ncbi:MAG TPA: TorF family putative porin, partial [Burkholderiaceae bacterium]|nr:TorF family putative porin [Burkholderiaceae bacterium]
MKQLIAAAGFAVLAAAVPSTGMAQDKKEASPHTLTGNLNLVSEYRYRGISQTNNKPAVQGGFDYAHASGVYVGTWASNVSWLSDGGSGTVSNSLEWDIYGGYKGTAGDFGYDVGLLYYYYPGKYPSGFNSPNTLEAYVAGSWKTLTLKYSHSLTDLFGFVDSKGSGYLDLTGTYDLGNGFSLVGHYGYQMIPSTTGRAR